MKHTTAIAFGMALVATPILAEMPRPDGLAALGEPPIPGSNPMSPEKVELGKIAVL